MAMTAELITKDPRTGRQFNVLDAEQFFVYDPSVPTIGDVAEKFGVHYITANKHAQRHRWRAKRAEAILKAHKSVAVKMKDELEESVAQRFRRMSRLIDNALDDAAIRPDEVGMGTVLKLIQVERELYQLLPESQSRERVLREHVERALRASGLQREEA